MWKLLCDACPVDQANRPYSDCGKVRAEMNVSAMVRAQKFDKRVHELERMNRICVPVVGVVVCVIATMDEVLVAQ